MCVLPTSHTQMNAVSFFLDVCAAWLEVSVCICIVLLQVGIRICIVLLQVGISILMYFNAS